MNKDPAPRAAQKYVNIPRMTNKLLVLSNYSVESWNFSSTLPSDFISNIVLLFGWTKSVIMLPV